MQTPIYSKMQNDISDVLDDNFNGQIGQQQFNKNNGQCELQSKSINGTECNLIGTQNSCEANDFISLIQSSCDTSIQELSLYNFKVNCLDKEFDIRNVFPNQQFLQQLTLQEFFFQNCFSIFIESIQQVTLNNTTIQQLDLDNRQKKKFENMFDDIYYSLLLPTTYTIIQSQTIQIFNQIYSDSQLLLDGLDFIFDSSTQILSAQIGIYREKTNPPQNKPLQINNASIKTFNINCLNSIEEAKKKMQYKSFFQYNFTSNQSFIDIPHFSNRAKLQAYLLEVLKNNYTMLIVTQTDSQIINSTLSTSKLGYFANNIYIEEQSIISSSGFGCPSDQGLGRGVIFGSIPSLNCSASGAHHTSYGGIGLPAIVGIAGYNNKTIDIINQCYINSQAAQFVSESFPYDSSHITEGSGGGMNLDPKDEVSYQDLGGAGGGLVVIGAASSLYLNGSIQCDGMKGSVVSNSFSGGGGSGGSVKIMASNFLGSGYINAKGGDSSEDGISGEGAGGIIDIAIEDSESILGTQNYYFKGILDVSKGKRNLDTKAFPFLLRFLAQNGSLITPFCPPGYQEQPRGTCIACSNSQYKDTPYGVCMKCPSSSNHESFSAPNITAGQFCQANCDKIICDPYGYYISIVGPYGIFFLQATLSILTTGYVIRRIYRLKQSNNDRLPFDFEEATEQMRIDDQIITTDLQRSHDFIMSDLLFHTHRIHVLGTNTLNNYWKLSRVPPPEVEYIINREQYRKFSERFNHTVRWSVFDKIILIFSSFVYYPLYWYLLTKVRKGVYKKARKFFEQNELKIINMNVSGQFDKVQIKFSKSNDYTLCFFDIFDYKNSNFKYFFLNIPYFISLSGDGSFIKPLNINENDVFCKCLYFSINRNRKIEIVNERQRVMENLVNHKLRIDNSKKLNKFIQKFNRHAMSIDYMAPVSYIIMSLEQTVELLNRWNQYFFNPNNVGANLVVFEKPKKDGFKEIITILENTDKEKFKSFVEKMVNSIRYMNEYYEIKLYLFVYNLDSPIETVAQTMDEQRINVNTEGHILHQTLKESVLSQDFISIKEKLQKREIIKIKQSSFHSRVSFVDDADMQSTNVDDFSLIKQIYKYIKRATGFIRFCFFTHCPTKLSKHFLIFSLTTIIVIDTVKSITLITYINNIIFNQQIMTIPTIFNASYALTQLKEKQIIIQDLLFLLIPYPFAVWISPIIGLLLVTSQSYGIAKMYVIYNSLSLVDLFLNIIWTFHDNSLPSTIPFVYILKIITLVFRLMILFLAQKYLSLSVKLTHLNSQKRSISL